MFFLKNSGKIKNFKFLTQFSTLRPAERLCVHTKDLLRVMRLKLVAILPSYKKCGYYDRKFKDIRAKNIHEANCKHYYDTTEEYYEIENIVDVFGRIEARWYLIKWKGSEVPK